MPSVISKLVGKNLEPYSLQSKFCNFTSGTCILEGKFGFTSFDFSSFENAQSCQLKFKRVSGNGLVAIVSESEATNYNIVSKVFENVSVDVSKSKKFSVLRPSSGIGNVELLSVSIIADGILEKNDGVDMRNELKKCKRRFIRLVGERVFANEGASIESEGKPIYIETEPPGMYRQEAGITKFLGLCEIVKLKVDVPSPHQFPKFLESARNASSLTPVGISVYSGFEGMLEQAASFTFRPDIDSSSSSQDTCVLPGGMSVGRYGAVTIPDISLDIGGKYVLVMKCKNMDGNGRITISVSGTDLNKTVYVGADDSVNLPFSVTLDSSHSLYINRSGPSDGNVWVSKIFIAKDETIYSQLIGGNKIFQDANIIKEFKRDISVDSFRYDILNFSKMEAEQYSEKFDSSIILNVKPCTQSMNSWVSKFVNAFDGITVDSSQLKGCKLYLSDPSTSVLMTDIRNLLKYKKIMLEEFNCVLNSQQIEFLQGTDVIFTPSLVNAQYLRSLAGVKRVLYVPKFWPFKQPSQRMIQGDYNLLISRSINSTLNFIKYYNSNKKLVIVGYRGADIDSETIQTFDEFLPYSDMLSLIYNSCTIIDFPDNIHYYSGVLDFALIAKKNIVTTNHWLNVLKPKAGIVETVLDKRHLLPNYQQAMLEVNKFTTASVNTDMSSYNNNIKSSLMIMAEG